MAYFGGGGVKGDLHPSLRTYIECFQSPPFPKAYPRGGGVWDQSPELMRDFRIIRNYELQWKETQEQMDQMKQQTDPHAIEQGGATDLDELLNEKLQEMGLEDDGYF